MVTQSGKRAEAILTALQTGCLTRLKAFTRINCCGRKEHSAVCQASCQAAAGLQAVRTSEQYEDAEVQAPNLKLAGGAQVLAGHRCWQGTSAGKAKVLARHAAFDVNTFSRGLIEAP